MLAGSSSANVDRSLIDITKNKTKRMLSCLKLPLNFDPAGLQADLDQIKPAEWVRHFNDRYYEGDWSGVALRAPDGAATDIYPDPNKPGSIADTSVLARCAAIPRVLASLECPVKSARLLKLGAGARIIEHRDYNLSLEDGEVRLHVPITTGPGVEFYLNGERITMNPGECWYINANLPHKVDNRGATDRVHLVIDCAVDDWLRSIVDKSTVESPSVVCITRISSPMEFERFRELVFEDASLQRALRQVADKKLFVDLVVRLGEERGFRFNEQDVETAFRASRRAWIERWV